MDLAQISTFLVVSVTLACTPGADWAYIISSALKKDSYYVAIWGLLSGYLVHTLLLACGIAALVAGSPTLLTWLTTAGALYLLWLGLSTLRSWKAAKFYNNDSLNTAIEPQRDGRGLPLPAAITSTTTAIIAERNIEASIDSKRSQYFKGLLTSGTNPKALLLYVALIPQFIDPSSAMPVAFQTSLFGLGHFLVSVVIYFAVAKVARRLLRSRPAAARVVTMCSGIIMIVISLMLFWEQFSVV